MDITGEVSIKVHISLENEVEVLQLMKILELVDESEFTLDVETEKLRLKLLEVLRDHTEGL